jgi:anti-sigma factor RsiW
MNCADLEILLCDYVDGTLPAEHRAEVEQHLTQCAACADLARDAAAAVAFMDRAADVEPPTELLNRILFHLPIGHEPAGARPRGILRSLRQWIQPVLQPRFAMGMAMTVLSFSMLARFAGLPAHQLNPADLSPVKVWESIDDKAHRLWGRSVKFYESLRVVYELQTSIREWTQQDQQDRQTAAPQSKPGARTSSQESGNKAALESVK